MVLIFWKFHKGEGRFLMYDNSRKGKCIIEESAQEPGELGQRNHRIWAGQDGKKIGEPVEFSTFCGYDRGPKFDSRLEKIWKEF